METEDPKGAWTPLDHPTEAAIEKARPKLEAALKAGDHFVTIGKRQWHWAAYSPNVKPEDIPPG